MRSLVTTGLRSAGTDTWTHRSARLSGFAVVGATAFLVQLALFNVLISVPVRPVVSNALAVNALTVFGVAMGTALRLYAYPRFVFTSTRPGTP